MGFIKMMFTGISLFVAGYLSAETAIAQSTKQGDSCMVTAVDSTWTTSSGNSFTGVTFTFKTIDGDRLDLHSKNLVIKATKNGQVIFVPDLTVGEVVNNFAFDEHGSKAGNDGEEEFKTKKAQFVAQSSPQQ